MVRSIDRIGRGVEIVLLLAVAAVLWPVWLYYDLFVFDGGVVTERAAWAALGAVVGVSVLVVWAGSDPRPSGCNDPGCRCTEVRG